MTDLGQSDQVDVLALALFVLYQRFLIVLLSGGDTGGELVAAQKLGDLGFRRGGGTPRRLPIRAAATMPAATASPWV